MKIESVGVLGAGTMGAQIALHLANAGVPSILLDVTRDAARQGLERARKLKPDPQFTPDAWTLVATGGFDEDLSRLAGVDWVVEAVVEQLDVKRALLERVAAVCRPDAVLSTNTSGIPIGAIAEGWPAERRARWLGTHFFNPPRYLALLEVIPTAQTGPAIVGRHRRLRRPRARQGRGRRQGHAQLHRQPPGAARRGGDAARRRVGPLLHRRGRRDHRAGDRPAGVGDVPHRRHRRPRRAGARPPQPRGAAAGGRRSRLVPDA